MSLDLAKTIPQVTALTARTQRDREDRSIRVALAVEQMRASSFDDVRDKQAAAGNRPYFWAEATESLGAAYPQPLTPQDFCVASADGSHIDVDRHLPVPCALINTGSCLLRYGANPEARLSNSPRLYSGDELYLTQQGDAIREVGLDGPVLGIQRTVEEIKALADLLRDAPADIPVLGLVDGTLVLFAALQQGQPALIEKLLLEDGFLAALSEIRLMGQRRTLSVASYISLPRGAEVVSALRLYLCGQSSAECQRVCSRRRSPNQPCSMVNHLQDWELFQQLLAPGERSTLFVSRSDVVEKSYGDHQVHFFYVNTGEEIGRVEMPRWVALDASLLSLTHALVMDQCRRGLGYPVAISEAHEQAVISGPDRQHFRDMLVLSLTGRGMPVFTSAKSRSKRMAWV